MKYLKELSLLIVILISVIGVSSLLADSSKSFSRTLATGNYECRVFINPSNSSGSARLDFEDVLGVVGEGPSVNINLGSGEDLISKCQAIAESISSLALSQSCTVSPIQNSIFDDGFGFVEGTVSFNILCNAGRNNVVNKIGTITSAFLTSEHASIEMMQLPSSDNE